jgi:hypothetical protein
MPGKSPTRQWVLVGNLKETLSKSPYAEIKKCDDYKQKPKIHDHSCRKRNGPCGGNTKLGKIIVGDVAVPKDD